MSESQDSPAPGAGGRKPRRSKPGRVVNPEARMPLIEHIRELRTRVIKAMLAMLAGSIGGWVIFTPVWGVLVQAVFRLAPRSPDARGGAPRAGPPFGQRPVGPA